MLINSKLRKPKDETLRVDTVPGPRVETWSPLKVTTGKQDDRLSLFFSNLDSGVPEDLTISLL